MKTIFIDMLKESVRGLSIIALASPFLMFATAILALLGRVLWDIATWSFSLW